MISTKSIYHDPAGPEDGYRLLVMRYWPRGVRKSAVDGWLRELAPTAALLGAYRASEIDWPTFVSRYRAEITGTAEGRSLLGQVQRLDAEHGAVTLLCHEDLKKADAHCHREVLKELLEVTPLVDHG